MFSYDKYNNKKKLSYYYKLYIISNIITIGDVYRPSVGPASLISGTVSESPPVTNIT